MKKKKISLFRNSNKEINFGIIGCGRIFTKHYEIFEKKLFKNVNLTAICDKTKIKLNKINNQKIKKYTDYEKMINDSNIQNIIILTESGNHFRIAKKCLLAKKNIIVEKPFCLKLKDAYELIKISRKVKRKIFVVMQNRFNEPVKISKKFLEKKKLGKLVSLAIRVRWFRDQSYYNLDKWRGSWLYDGGALTNQGIHHIDLLQFFGGAIDYVSCYSSKRLSKIESEDTAVGILKFRNGAIGTLEVTTGARPKDLEGSISILGEKGTIEIGGFAANKIKTWLFLNNKDNIRYRQYFENPKNVYGFGHKKFYQQVINSLNGKKNFAVTGEESLKSLHILHALYESSIKKKTIIVNKKNFTNKLNLA